MNILKRPTLVLNKNWQPISTVTVQDAITMLFGEFSDDKGNKLPKCKVLDIDTWQIYPWEAWSNLEPKEGEPVLHAGRGQKFRVPNIIIATRYNKIPNSYLNYTRDNVFRRDMHTCCYCGNPGNSIDHVIPKSKGGKTNWENCVVCCFKCNQKKKDKFLSEVNMRLLKQPCKPVELIAQTHFNMKSWEIFFKVKSE